MKCKLRTSRGLEVTSCIRQWHVEHQEPLWALSRAALLWIHSWSLGECVQGGEPRLAGAVGAAAMASWASPSSQPCRTCPVPLLSWQNCETQISVWSHLGLPLSPSKGGTLSCFACCHFLTLSHLFLFSCHSSPCSSTFPGRVWCLQRSWECPQWLTFIFICRPSRKFLSPLTHSSQLCIFSPLEYFSHQFFFSFPLGSSRITKPQSTVSENWRYFPPLSLSCFGICNLLPPFLFSYKKQCVPYMMAYIKQIFIDLGSAYSFLEGIQIWLGN